MKIIIGKVISTKQEKTATVLVERMVIHPLYKKRYMRAKKYQVHDEIGALVNQNVKFVASKPYSKSKKWKIIEVIENVKKSSKGKDKK
jgi:small subunit ribosomal protein S17